jgi:2-C-methyl-D-erythritol 2,4-cyclodiphosphate synthase
MNIRVGTGYDSHRLELGKPLVIGGVHIPHSSGFVAHSDGDLLIHAICDALLGAAALPDIGSNFPDTNPQYRNIDSKILLQKVVELIYNQGYKINNIDCTIIMEKPKMAPHIPAMRTILCSTLNIELQQLSIKAKTNEKIGFIGREEGAVAMVMVSLIEN